MFVLLELNCEILFTDLRLHLQLETLTLNTTPSTKVKNDSRIQITSVESGRGGLPEVSAQLFHFYKNDILENWSLKRGGRLWRLDCKKTSREYALVHYVF